MDKKSFFPGQNKIEAEAHEINEKVDDYYDRPRINKSRSVDDVAQEIIKNEPSRSIKLENVRKDERLWLENMRKAGIRVLQNGFLEISRRKSADEDATDSSRIWQRVDDINIAIRMQDHILKTYRSEEKTQPGEYTRIESIQEIIERANDLLTSWNTASPENKIDLQMQLAHVILQLEYCRDEFKVAAREQSEAILPLKDSLDRENPGALAARTVAALNRLADRIGKMQMIMPFIALRKELLILEKMRSVGALKKSRARISEILNHAVFKNHPAKSSADLIKENEVGILNKKIGQILSLLETVRVLPYSQQAEQVHFRLFTEAKKYFSSKKKLVGNIEAARHALQDAIGIINADVKTLFDKKRKPTE